MQNVLKYAPNAEHVKTVLNSVEHAACAITVFRYAKTADSTVANVQDSVKYAVFVKNVQ